MRSRERSTSRNPGSPLHRRRLLLSALAVVALAVTFLPAGLRSSAQGTPASGALPELSVAEKTGGTLNVGISADAAQFDPILTQDNPSLWTEMEVFSRLVRVNTAGTDIEGDLASSWDVSDDGTVYTFHLRPEAKFSDGTPVTADDVVFSFERGVGEQSLVAWTFDAVKSVEAVDPQTVKITLKGPAAPFANDIALWGASIVSKSAVEKAGDGFATAPVGSGPFMLESWDKGTQITLKKNPHYWEKDASGNSLPYLDQVNLLVLPDDNTRMLKLQAGEIDAALDIPYNQIATLGQDPALQVSATPLFGITGISLNQGKQEFTDVNIRQAMNYAIDRDALVQTALFGNGLPACSPINRVWFYTDKYCYHYDLEKAKQLMAASSAPDGFKTSLMVPAGDTVSNQLAVMVKDMLSKINIDVEIQPIDSGTLWDRWSKLDYEMVMGSGTSDNLDPNANMLFCCVSDGGADSSYTGWKDPDVDAVFRKTQTEMDFAKRGELYDEFQKLVMERGPFIELVHQVNRYGSQSKVHNFFLDPTAHWHFEYAWIDQ